MDDFFFASDPWSAFYHPAYSQPPAYTVHRPFTMPAAYPSRHQRRPVSSPAPAPSPSPAMAQRTRGVTVPVRYADVEGWDNRKVAKMCFTPSKAATEIQRVFRGFFVRRMVERVSQIAAEVDAIEEMVASETEREKIRSEPRERLRVGETLMALLLRLDSVQGVREYRRKVIRRVIRLQEMVDSIPAATQTPGAPTHTADETVEEERPDEIASNDALEEQRCFGKTAVAESANVLIPDVEEALEEETVNMVDTPQECKAEEMMQQEGYSDIIAEEEEARDDQSAVVLEAAAATQDETSKMMEDCEGKHLFNDEFNDFVVVSMDEDSCSVPAAIEPENLNKDHNIESFVDIAEKNTALPETIEVAMASTMMEKNSPSGGDMEDAMEKVMAENQKLQLLVAALCERNTQQCQLIAGLVSRVDRLEQTVQKMEDKKKKKKRLANSILASPAGKKNNPNDGMSQFML